MLLANLVQLEMAILKVLCLMLKEIGLNF